MKKKKLTNIQIWLRKILFCKVYWKGILIEVVINKDPFQNRNITTHVANYWKYLMLYPWNITNLKIYQQEIQQLSQKTKLTWPESNNNLVKQAQFHCPNIHICKVRFLACNSIPIITIQVNQRSISPET